MPNFAQAYGVQCSVCHTQVPALNAYGRYIQRTGYAALNPHVLKKEYPLWIDYSTTYTEQTPNAAQWQGGNLGIHADGTLGPGVTNWSYHVQQWLWEGNAAGRPRYGLGRVSQFARPGRASVRRKSRVTGSLGISANGST